MQCDYQLLYKAKNAEFNELLSEFDDFKGLTF